MKRREFLVASLGTVATLALGLALWPAGRGRALRQRAVATLFPGRVRPWPPPDLEKPGKWAG